MGGAELSPYIAVIVGVAGLTCGIGLQWICSVSMQILSNSFSVLDSEMNSIGGGVYLV